MARTSAFFPETDDPKLGIQPKSLAAGLLFEDALLEWRLTTVFQIVGGDRIVPFSRNGLESTLSYLTLDVSRISTVMRTRKNTALRDASKPKGSSIMTTFSTDWGNSAPNDVG